MNGAEIGLCLSVFLACAVEAVEALTIVLAVGATRGWRSTLSGVAAACAALALIVAALGPALTSLPIDALRVVVGGLLLTFGLQWLRKAILRAAGLRAMHDELRIYRDETAAARAAGAVTRGFDGYSFAIAFKGVLLEGLEVAFIVLTFGANQQRIDLAAAAAAVAVLVVVLAGVAARKPLARVPENTIKFAVGVMLSSFGIFWGAEGAGAHWPAGDAALVAIVPGVLLVALAMASVIRRTAPHGASRSGPRVRVQPEGQAGSARSDRRVAAAIRAVWEFVAGDDWRMALGVALALAATALLAAGGVAAMWVLPTATIALLAFSLRRAARAPAPGRAGAPTL
jgi:uncharacterized membrane protein